MRISFDLDDTLICGPDVPAEPHPSRWRRWRYPEPLRQGTCTLMAALAQRHCRIWLYTSSSRSPRTLKAWFASLGISIEGVVNQSRHLRAIGPRGPSKFPPMFGIDLHIDDSLGVAMEGERHRFPVLRIAPEDPDWAARILQEVDAHISANTLWQARRIPSGWRLGVGVGRLFQTLLGEDRGGTEAAVLPLR